MFSAKKEFSIVIAFVFAVLFLMSSIIVAARPIDESRYVKINISTGDTLWHLAKEYDDYHTLSHQQFIDWVTRHNRIHPEQLSIGEELMIPVEKGQIE